MRNPNFSRILKYYRKLNRYKVSDIAEIFQQRGENIAVKTIYGWESGQTQPSADALMFLCELYHIENVLQTFGYTEQQEEDSILLTSTEQQIIKGLRKHPEYEASVLKLLDIKKSD